MSNPPPPQKMEKLNESSQCSALHYYEGGLSKA